MRYDFAGLTLDTAQHLLLRNGDPVPIEPRVFDLVHLLVDRAGELVTRDELVAEVWGGRIVSESAISACTAAARKAVGDDGKRQAVIRTVPRRGLQLAVLLDGADPPPAAPVRPRIRFTTTDTGRSIAYSLLGDGAPVLRIGHNLADIEGDWHVPNERSFLERVAAQCRVLIFDQIGNGQSDREDPDYDFARCAANARAVADAAGFDRFAVFSESGGALTAINFAAMYPERVSRLAILGGYVDGRSLRLAAPKNDAIRGLIAEGWATPDSGFAMAILASYFPEGPLDTVRDYARVAQQAITPENALRVRDAINSASVAHLLPQVRCPALILHARHDAVHPLSEARKLAAGLPDAELVVLETANTIPLIGNPVWEEFVETLVSFLVG